MRIDFTHTGLTSDFILSHENAFDTLSSQLLEGVETGIYEHPYHVTRLPFDEHILKECVHLTSVLKNNSLRFVIQIGIGGSNLATKAIYDAFVSPDDKTTRSRTPTLITLDTIDMEALMRVRSMFGSRIADPKHVVIVVSSKSGNTIETLANLSYLLDSQEVREFTEGRIVAITDEGSKLDVLASHSQWHILRAPKVIGGRFSLLTHTHIFPLLLLDFPVSNIIEGAKKAVLDLEEGGKNIHAQSALALYSAERKGVSLHTLFLSPPSFESIGKWYKQLLAESIGKEEDLLGHPIRTGIVPTISLGTTDFHSELQLQLAGPNNRFTTFIFFQSGNTEELSQNTSGAQILPFLAGKKLEDILLALMKGVETSFIEKQRMFVSISFKNDLSFELGYFMMHKMIEMIYLGHLYNIDIFNQPAVENYKQEARRHLS